MHQQIELENGKAFDTIPSTCFCFYLYFFRAINVTGFLQVYKQPDLAVRL